MSFSRFLLSCLPLRLLLWYEARLLARQKRLTGKINQYMDLYHDVEEKEYTLIYREHLRRQITLAHRERALVARKQEVLAPILAP